MYELILERRVTVRASEAEQKFVSDVAEEALRKDFDQGATAVLDSATSRSGEPTHQPDAISTARPSPQIASVEIGPDIEIDKVGGKEIGTAHASLKVTLEEDAPIDGMALTLTTRDADVRFEPVTPLVPAGTRSVLVRLEFRLTPTARTIQVMVTNPRGEGKSGLLDLPAAH